MIDVKSAIIAPNPQFLVMSWSCQSWCLSEMQGLLYFTRSDCVLCFIESVTIHLLLYFVSYVEKWDKGLCHLLPATTFVLNLLNAFIAKCEHIWENIPNNELYVFWQKGNFLQF